MTLITFEIETRPGKKEELLQTLGELHPILCGQGGGCQANVLQPKLDNNVITVNQKWENAVAALRYFHSEPFQVLCGAINVLALSVKVTIGTESQSANLDLKNYDLRKNIYPWAEKILSETETESLVIAKKENTN